MEFRVLKFAVSEQFETMKDKPLFRTGAGKDEMWETYLSSFPEGTDPIFRERSEHDCQGCRRFVRSVGNLVALVDGKIISIWDIHIGGGKYQPVVDALSALVKSYPIENIFVSRFGTAGAEKNYEETATGVLTWEHLHIKIPGAYVIADPGPVLSVARSTKDVLLRGLQEISVEALETTLDLLGSIYRGEEHRASVSKFLALKKEFDQQLAGLSQENADNFCWARLGLAQSLTRIRNTAIGTLLVDIAEGVDLERAVKSFETKVAPQNYKRPTALITKGMIRKAQEKIEELGYTEALPRRYAVAEDLTINNVLFADRTSRIQGNVFDEMVSEVPVKAPDQIEDMTITKFLAEVLPSAQSIELLVENKHSGNFFSLIAPVDVEAKGMFKWGNNFSWAYTGEVADSMKARVKALGGDVEGVLRFSIQWNEDNDNQNDFDAHCLEPNGNLISFPKKGRRQPSTGMLDVDIVTPGTRVAVENITWLDERKMQEGVYEMLVHNYSHNGGRSGFSAEIEYAGQIHSYTYAKELRQGQKVLVAKLKYTHEGGIEFIKSLPSTAASKELWGVKTQVYQKVQLVMFSPNHWDGEATGNKHVFFVLDGCAQEGQARGFFNEFLTDDLREHRKVFEVLGSKMRTDPSDNQLSGVGFSTTKDSSVVCRVAGRNIRIQF